MNASEPANTIKIDLLRVNIYQDRFALGTAAGYDVASKMKELLRLKSGIRMIFAAAPSQNELLSSLLQDTGIDWSRITVFQMDEYIGIPNDAPQLFSSYLCGRLFDQVKPAAVHLIDSSNAIEEECRRYGELLREAPIDIVCLGIGENGHIAFNDPPIADFNDSAVIKPVELEDACRRQQVNDGCFPSIEAVPTHALTLTIPTLMSGRHLYCVVPGSTKRRALYLTLNGPISTECPSSILRKHPDCILYADLDSYGQ